MEDDPQYRHFVQELKESRDSELESRGVNVGVVDNGQTTLTTNTDSQLMYTQHASNVKKAIARIKGKIAAEKHNMKNNLENNFGSQLNGAMLGMLINNMQVAEVYSPPMVVEMANKMGLRGGWGLDLTTTDDDELPWDFNSLKMRNRAVRKLTRDKPLVIIGSPMCTAYGVMNRINYCKMPEEDVAAKLAYARRHLEFCATLYEIQWPNGRYFLHENPDGAWSWDEFVMEKFMSRAGVQKVVGDQCQYGFKSRDEQGIAPARKRTGFFTNAVCIAKWLSKRCPNSPHYQVHRHVTLQGGRARAAQIYLDKLCREICLGIQEQVQRDRDGQYLFANITTEEEPSEQLMKVAKELEEKYQIVEENEDELVEEICDDVFGVSPDPKMVKRARQEEIDYIHKMSRYSKVQIQ